MLSVTSAVLFVSAVFVVFVDCVCFALVSVPVLVVFPGLVSVLPVMSVVSIVSSDLYCMCYLWFTSVGCSVGYDCGVCTGSMTCGVCCVWKVSVESAVRVVSLISVVHGHGVIVVYGVRGDCAPVTFVVSAVPVMRCLRCLRKGCFSTAVIGFLRFTY